MGRKQQNNCHNFFETNGFQQFAHIIPGSLAGRVEEGNSTVRTVALLAVDFGKMMVRVSSQGSDAGFTPVSLSLLLISG